jgi:hypothetical protein
MWVTVFLWRAEAHSMNQKSTYNYVAALEEVTPPPAMAERTSPPSQTVVSDSTIGLVVISANLFFTVILMAGMSWFGAPALQSILIGGIYFCASTPFYLLIITGALTAIANVAQQECTERQRIAAYERVMHTAFEWRMMVEQNRTAELQAQAMPLQLTQRIAMLETRLLEQQVGTGGVQPPTFVAPYANHNTTASEAVAWASNLYDDMGKPDKDKVQLTGDEASIGRLKVRMLSSKRGTGSNEAGLFLLQNRVIQRVQGGYMLNLKHFPHREALRQIL